MKYILKCKEVFLEDEVKNNYSILIDDGIIRTIDKDINHNCNVIDLSKYKAIPGLVDLHIHGGNGYDTMDGTYESLNGISKFVARYRVTSFLPTTVTAPMDNIEKAVINLKETMEKGVDGAEILGLYLEGPYLTEEHKGAHPPSFMRPLNLEEIQRLIDLSSNNIRIITIAPEKKGSNEVIKYLKDSGVKVSIGHTNATYDEVMDAFDIGASIGVHTFNGMRGLHHREPGVVGAILNRREVYAELIADNIHVHPGVMSILYRLKDSDKMYLISDCMRAGGLKDGEYMLGELKVIVKNSIARTQNGSLAGSSLKIIEALKNIINATGISLHEAVKMATITPARALNLDNSIGSIKENKKANIAIIDDELNVVMTIINGKIVHKNF
jgi:N-acetylglucosamine-6-phosphate deacetylase